MGKVENRSEANVIQVPEYSGTVVADDARSPRLAPGWFWFSLVIAIVIVLLAFISIIVWVPELLVHQHGAGNDAYLKAVTDNRTALIQAFGGFGVFLGVLVGFFTLRHNRQMLHASRTEHLESLRASHAEHLQSLQASGDALRDTLEFNRESLARTMAVTERGQITDRFSKAIEQIGNTNVNSVDLRLGGIYALEQIAVDSPAWYAPVLEVLAAFVRQNSPGTLPAMAPLDIDLNEALKQAPDQLVSMRPDIAAAVRILCRRDRSRDVVKLGVWPSIRLINFREADFRGVSFPRDCDFSGIDFGFALMQSASLSMVKLRGCMFAATNLEGASLFGSDLSTASLWMTKLQSANLENAILEDANLQFAVLKDAKLKNANFQGAKMGHTRLSSVDLSEALNLTIDQLREASLDETTVLPSGIDRAALDATADSQGT